MGASAPGHDLAPPDALERAVHDLQGPLTVIRGMCATLLRDERALDRRRALGLIDTEAVRLAGGLRALARPPERGAAAIESRCDLAALVAEAELRFDPLARARSRRVVARGRRAPTPVVGDPDLLRRALDNLVWNALRHGARGGVVIVGLAVRGGWAEVRVRDDGPGVPEEDRERIFAAGERGSAPRDEGRGLGLAIAREIAESHGGRLTLDPLGAGACFRLALPLQGGADPEPRAA
jgi:signal transduction histidine kinase